MKFRNTDVPQPPARPDEQTTLAGALWRPGAWFENEPPALWVEGEDESPEHFAEFALAA